MSRRPFARLAWLALCALLWWLASVLASAGVRAVIVALWADKRVPE